MSIDTRDTSDPPSSAAPAPTPESGILTRRDITVLLVDDQPLVGEAVRRMVQNEKDIHFFYCSDPSQAIPMADRVQPTVILQDLVMPEVDGLLLLKFYRVCPATRDVPIIVLSAKEEPLVKAEAFALGANDYLVKLPDRIELLARIRHHSQGYIHLQERNEAFAALQTSLEQLRIEQEKSERLLLNVLPASIADRLKSGEKTIADSFPEVSVLFADICGFTELSSRVTPPELVEMLNRLFTSFDLQAEELGLEKIKTIGDAYMAVAGLPLERRDHAELAVRMGEFMTKEIHHFNLTGNTELNMRIGIHSGPVVAGVIGKRKFIYDLWGDTVNTASRMESHGVPGRVQVSDATYRITSHRFEFEPRGTIKVKGKGDMSVYLLAQPEKAQPAAASTDQSKDLSTDEIGT